MPPFGPRGPWRSAPGWWSRRGRWSTATTFGTSTSMAMPHQRLLHVIAEARRDQRVEDVVGGGGDQQGQPVRPGPCRQAHAEAAAAAGPVLDHEGLAEAGFEGRVPAAVRRRRSTRRAPRARCRVTGRDGQPSCAARRCRAAGRARPAAPHGGRDECIEVPPAFLRCPGYRAAAIRRGKGKSGGHAGPGGGDRWSARWRSAAAARARPVWSRRTDGMLSLTVSGPEPARRRPSAGCTTRRRIAPRRGGRPRSSAPGWGGRTTSWPSAAPGATAGTEGPQTAFTQPVARRSRHGGCCSRRRRRC